MNLRITSICLGLAAGLVATACQPDSGPTGPADDSTPSFAKKSSGNGTALSPGVDASDASTGLHLVVFKSGNRVPADLSRAVNAAGGSVETAYSKFGYATVAGLDDSGVAALLARKDVAYVEADQLLQLDVPGTMEPVALDDAGITSIDDPTTALLFGLQWNLRAIFAHDAWAAGKLGSGDVTVAILDTGLDYQNPDLSGRVDLSRSVSLIPSDDALVDAMFPGTNHITDLNFHGTNVGSVAASNAWGFAGVTSKTTLIGVKVCDWEGSCPTSAVLGGIIYAADNGADVINMSLGGSFSKSMFPGFVSLINRVTNYARSQGSLIVVSAGNAAADLDHDGNSFEAYCNAPSVVCVSATAPTYAGFPVFENVDTPASYTNFGRSAINVAAPGGDVVPGGDGWVYSICSTTSLVIPICQTGVFVLGVAGTSQAAPHASGVAALIVDEIGSGRPAQVKARLLQTADDLGQPGTDPYFGKGRVNALAATQ
jgi:subtilisin family serine protease